MANRNAERQYRRAFISISDVVGGGRVMQGFSHACSSRTLSLNEIIMFLRHVFLAGLQEHGVLLRECSRWVSMRSMYAFKFYLCELLFMNVCKYVCMYFLSIRVLEGARQQANMHFMIFELE